MTHGHHTHMEFALFPSRQRAARAKQAVESRRDSEAELITEPHELTHDKIPLSLTMVRVGSIVGAAAVAGLMLAGLTLLLGLEVDALPRPMASPFVALLTITMLAALLGGLAGALSFSTEARETLEQLRAQLRYRRARPGQPKPAVLLVESDDELAGMLRRHGALRTGTLV